MIDARYVDDDMDGDDMVNIYNHEFWRGFWFGVIMTSVIGGLSFFLLISAFW